MYRFDVGVFANRIMKFSLCVYSDAFVADCCLGFTIGAFFDFLSRFFRASYTGSYIFSREHGSMGSPKVSNASISICIGWLSYWVILLSDY